MLRYRPPKSSVWGHKLPKMSVLRQRALVDEFLASATAESSKQSASFFVHGLKGEKLARYSEVLQREVSANDNPLYLTPEQSDLCIEEFDRSQEFEAKSNCLMFLMQLIDIPKWRIRGEVVPAYESQIWVYYASPARIATTFYFDTVEQFHEVQGALADLQLCKLSDVHLKPVKRNIPK